MDARNKIQRDILPIPDMPHAGEGRVEMTEPTTATADETAGVAMAVQ